MFGFKEALKLWDGNARAREGAPIAVPLEWNELTPELRPDQFTIRNVAARLERLRRDPFERMATLKQRLRQP